MPQLTYKLLVLTAQRFDLVVEFTVQEVQFLNLVLLRRGALGLVLRPLLQTAYPLLQRLVAMQGLR